ncbi:DUF262 domain-containing protein [Tessaracoccus sp.]
MTLQTDTPITHTSMTASNRSAREIARNEETFVDAPYQRGPVWTTGQRIMFVRSWLMGVPIPSIVVNDRSKHAWADQTGYPTDGRFIAVIDGRQRVETARAWFDGDLPVPASWFDPEHVETTVNTADGPYVTFLGLTLTGQRLMSNRAMLPTVEAQVGTLAQEAALYLLLNGAGTIQTDQDMTNAARYTHDHT